MPWPWEREPRGRRPPVLNRLEEALSLLDRRIVDLRAEVDRLKALREAQERRGTGPCRNS